MKASMKRNVGNHKWYTYRKTWEIIVLKIYRKTNYDQVIFIGSIGYKYTYRKQVVAIPCWE